MDFKKILSSFDAVENDTSVGSVEKQKQTGSMLAILESFNRVETEENVADEVAVEEENIAEEVEVEEGRMSDQVIHDSETMTKEEFAKKHGKEMADEYYESVEEATDETDEEAVTEENSEEELEEAIMVSAEGDEAAQLLSILQLAGMPAPAPAMPAPMEPEMEPQMDMQDEYSNSPDEVEQDVDAVIASGDDLHREKDQYAASADGDNPMKAFEGKFKSILDELLAEDEK